MLFNAFQDVPFSNLSNSFTLLFTWTDNHNQARESSDASQKSDDDSYHADDEATLSSSSDEDEEEEGKFELRMCCIYSVPLYYNHCLSSQMLLYIFALQPNFKH